MEVVDRFQRENGHVPCLHLLGQLRINELCLLIGRDIIPIADGRLFLLLVHYSWKGYQDAMLRCMTD